MIAVMSGLLLPPILALVLAAGPIGPGPEPGPQAGPRVTTDTVEYCGSLASRLAGMPAANQEPSRSLGVEGVRLCRNGYIRTGIAKLRRAIRAAQGGAVGG